MAYRNLIVSDRGALRIITFNRPEVLNALNASTIDELSQAIDDINGASGVRCVILTGAKGEGRESFIAGADIKEMKNYTPLEAEYFSQKGHKVLEGLASLPMPVIAAVNGFALGGGPSWLWLVTLFTRVKTRCWAWSKRIWVSFLVLVALRDYRAGWVQQGPKNISSRLPIICR